VQQRSSDADDEPGGFTGRDIRHDGSHADPAANLQPERRLNQPVLVEPIYW
jgi:hypothetical protein